MLEGKAYRDRQHCSRLEETHVLQVDGLHGGVVCTASARLAFSNASFICDTATRLQLRADSRVTTLYTIAADRQTPDSTAECALSRSTQVRMSSTGLVLIPCNTRARDGGRGGHSSSHWQNKESEQSDRINRRVGRRRAIIRSCIFGRVV